MVLTPPGNVSIGVKKRNLVNVAQQAISMAIISVLLITTVGTSAAIANHEHTLATTLKGIASTLVRTSTAPMSLIEQVRGVAAIYERNIVSELLQSMRVIEGLHDIPPVTVPTSDMAHFPVAEYSLFPDYIETRFSQFKYTVDSNGIVSVDTSVATADTLTERIEFLLHDNSKVLQ